MTKVGVLHEITPISGRFLQKLISLMSSLAHYNNDNNNNNNEIVHTQERSPNVRIVFSHTIKDGF